MPKKRETSRVHWGTGYECPRTRPGDTETTDPKKVTCSSCQNYVKRTGDGPESLKSLLRF